MAWPVPSTEIDLKVILSEDRENVRPLVNPPPALLKENQRKQERIAELLVKLDDF